MTPALLLFNPAAGRRRAERVRTVDRVIATLRNQGFALQSQATFAKGSASGQAREAVAHGAQTVFACGGDGTVHDVLQGIAGADVCLGIIPTGSANALAQELGLPSDPVRAAQSLAPDRFQRIRTLVVRRSGQPDLFSLCMAGAGPDGLLMYRMLTVNRGVLGRWRYYEHALRVFLTHRFPTFRVQLQQTDGTLRMRHVVSAMALRVGDLQGIFRGIAKGASIRDEALHVILIAGPARLTLPLWFVLSWLGLGGLHPGVSTHKIRSLSTTTAIPVQVDGEWAGHAGASFTLDGPWQRVLSPPRADEPRS